MAATEKIVCLWFFRLKWNGLHRINLFKWNSNYDKKIIGQIMGLSLSSAIGQTIFFIFSFKKSNFSNETSFLISSFSVSIVFENVMWILTNLKRQRNNQRSETFLAAKLLVKGRRRGKTHIKFNQLLDVVVCNSIVWFLKWNVRMKFFLFKRVSGDFSNVNWFCQIAF